MIQDHSPNARIHTIVTYPNMVASYTIYDTMV